MGVRGTIHLLESAIVPYGGDVSREVERKIEEMESDDSDHLLWMVGTLPNMRKAKRAIGCDTNGVHAVSTFAVGDGHGGQLVVEGIKHGK
jgi:hypothetical protein